MSALVKFFKASMNFYRRTLRPIMILLLVAGITIFGNVGLLLLIAVGGIITMLAWSCIGIYIARFIWVIKNCKYDYSKGEWEKKAFPLHLRIDENDPYK